MKWLHQIHRPELPTWCGAFNACESGAVAVVGNGPLSAQQRSELNSGHYQVIVRFNYLNNRCRRLSSSPSTSEVLCKPLHGAEPLPEYQGSCSSYLVWPADAQVCIADCLESKWMYG